MDVQDRPEAFRGPDESPEPDPGAAPVGRAAGAARRDRAFELLVFLALIVPSMVLSFFAAASPSNVGFRMVAFSTIVRDLSLVALILYFLRKNREPAVRIGWTGRAMGREAVVGIVLFLPFTLLMSAVEAGFRAAGLSAPLKPLPSFLTAKGPADYAVAAVLVVIVAFSEETIFRGYLILRLEQLLDSPALAVLVSAAIFLLGHGYEGAAGAATVGVMGVVFGAIYLWRRSLVAPMVIHFLQDFTGIILVPLLGAGGHR